VIHVAGTNGKGSTIAMLRAIYQAQGYKVHVITSPHLYDITERLILDNTQITQNSLWNALKEHESLAKKHGLSWYEILIGVFFVLASKIPADVMLLEVGLGGEFDATNVINTPALCLITPISLDHHGFLGSDLKNIAKAKAGIIKQGCPCLSAPQTPDVRTVLEETAQQNGSWFQCISLNHKTAPQPNLLGEHQRDNAQLVIEASSLLQERLPVTKEAIERGLQNIIWPGRLEFLKQIEGINLWYDVAHNPASAQAVHDFFIKRPGRKCLLFALSKSKDAKETLKPLVETFENLIFFTPKDADSYYSAGALADISRKLGRESEVSKNLKAALKKAISLKPSDILVAGSHYFSAELRDL
jgi:dihydrofolate synthase/folylpolyglutamate synthase